MPAFHVEAPLLFSRFIQVWCLTIPRSLWVLTYSSADVVLDLHPSFSYCLKASAHNIFLDHILFPPSNPSRFLLPPYPPKFMFLFFFFIFLLQTKQTKTPTKHDNQNQPINKQTNSTVMKKTLRQNKKHPQNEEYFLHLLVQPVLVCSWQTWCRFIGKPIFPFPAVVGDYK